jgi:hypothetical protein
MVNNSSMNDKQVARSTATMQKDFAKIYSGEGSTAQLVVQPVSSDDGSCGVVITLIDVKSNPIFDKETNEIISVTYPGGETPLEFVGQTQKASIEVIVNVDGSNRSNSDISRSFNHEIGHEAGLSHPWSPNNNVSDIKQGTPNVSNGAVRNNIMNSDKNTNIENRSTSGTSITSGQIQSIDALIKEQTKTN